MYAKSNKKYKKFFDDKATPSKRVKFLSQIAPSVDDADLKGFLKENYSIVGSLLADRFSDFAKAKSSSKHCTQADLEMLLFLLEAFIVHCLRDHQGKRQDIERWIGGVLGIHNKHAIRVRGIQLLLTLTQTLLNAGLPLESTPALFGKAVYYRPFHDLCRPPNLHESDMAFCAATTAPSKEECLETVQMIIDFSIAKERSFADWFEIIKREMLPVLYRDICKELEIVSKFPEGSFASCPPDIQQLMIGTIERWVESPVMSKVVWMKDSNHGKIMMEIFRQALRLPIEYQETILKAVQLFHTIIVAQKTKAIPTVLGGPEQIQIYWQDYVWHMARAFNIYSDSKTMSKHVEVCNAVLSQYVEMSMQHRDAMNEQTWLGIQNTLLHTVCDIFDSSTPFAVSHISADMDIPLMKTLFIVWIRSPYTREEMWQELKNKLTTYLDWRAITTEWSDKVLQLTHVLIDELYGREEKKQDSAAQKRKMEKINAEWARVDKKEELVRDPAVTEGLHWTASTIRHMWNTMLHILGNVNNITDLANFTTAIQCCSQVVDLLMAAEDEKPPGSHPIMPIYEIFLPWLFEAGMIDEKRNRGRLVACSTICRMFMRPHLVDAIPAELYSYFYHIIINGLSTQHSSIKWNIIRHSHNIFALALPGAQLLMPHYLREIPALFQSKSVPENVQLRAVSILMSLVCIPNHFKDLSIAYEGKTLSSMDIRNSISSTLLAALESDVLSPAVRCDLLYCLMLVVMDDLTNEGRVQVVQQCIQALMDGTSDANEEVAKGALTCIQALTSQYDNLSSLDVETVGPMLSLLSSNVITLIKQRLSSDVIAATILCLLDWALAANLFLLDNTALMDQVCVAVEYGLLGEPAPVQGSQQPSTTGGASDKLESKSSKRRTRFLGKTGRSVSETSSQVESVLSMLDVLNAAPSHGSEKVREAAEVALMGLLTCFNNFPAPEGATEGKLAEDEVSNAQFFVLNDSMLLSFEQIRPVPEMSDAMKRAIAVAEGGEKKKKEEEERSESEKEEEKGESDAKAKEGEKSADSDAEEKEKTDELDGGEKATGSGEEKSEEGEGKRAVELPKSDSTGSVTEEGGEKADAGDGESEGRMVRKLEPDSPEGPPLVRVTVRDCCGRVTWDCQMIHAEADTSQKRLLEKRLKRARKLIKSTHAQHATLKKSEQEADEAGADLPKYVRSTKSAPVYSADRDYADVPMVNDMLEYLSSVTDQVVQSGEAYMKAHPQKVDEMTEIVRDQVKDEEGADVDRSLHEVVSVQPEPIEVPSHFHYCRLLMSHLGLLDEAYVKNLHFLKFGKRLKRSLKELDKVTGREMIKIGLIYVRDPQTNQHDILKNKIGSKKYVDFVQGLGWSVHIPTHCDYKGGLDERSTGDSAPYWANALMEVIFHDITRMPTVADDPQQIHKKRHVGNDSVHIVWSQNPREYSPMTVTSQFNDAHIVVYPINNGLYRLQVFKKKKLPPFGPIRDGMVLTKKLLPELVRTAAVNANASARATQEVYKKPYPTRLTLIKQLISRYKVQLPVEEFLVALFPQEGDYLAESPVAARRSNRGGGAVSSRAASQRE